MIYLDNAATTRPLPEVVDAMLPYLREQYGNASTIYELGQSSRAQLMKARKNLADLIGADRDEIFFTSGGSESDNWAIKGVFDMWKREHPEGGSPHIITTKIEHEAILNTCRYLEKQGAAVTYLDVDRDGFVDPDTVRAAIRDDTALISVMTANNEIGTIEPVAEIGRIAHERGILFHTDAVQAFGQIPLNVKNMDIDLLSASGHKFYGPKGAGLLYIRRGILLPPLIHGGGQERGRRAGTENLPGAAGMAKAAGIAGRDMEERMRRESRLRDLLIRLAFEAIPDISLNGPMPETALAAMQNGSVPAGVIPDRQTVPGHEAGCAVSGQQVSQPADLRLPGNVNLVISGVEGETLLTMLDMKGICASSGSACSSGSLDPSHVLLSCGKTNAEARSSVRFSIGTYNTEEEIVKTVKILADCAEKLRAYT